MTVRASRHVLATADQPATERVLRSAAVAPLLTLFAELGSSPKGLTEADAAVRAVPDGGLRPTVLPLAMSALGGPFVLLLTGLGVVFALLGDVRGWVTVAVMVGLSVGLRGMAVRRARRAVAALSGASAATASVRRRASQAAATVTRAVPVDDLVAGDVVARSAGDVVPADVRVLRGRGLRVDQSVLSGESRPVAKVGEVLVQRAGESLRLFHLKREAGAVGAAGVAHLALVQLAHAPHHPQAQAEATGPQVGAVACFEYLRRRLGRRARAGVAHGQLQPAALVQPRADAHRAGRTVLDRVVHQIGQGDAHQRGVVGG